MSNNTNQQAGGRPRVFVYGTLKKGEANHYALSGEDCTLLGTAILNGNYQFNDLGWYPAVIEVPGEVHTSIRGEVYEISPEVLSALDIIEGHPHYYRRSKLPKIGRFKNTWVYTLPNGFAGQGEPVRDGGNWSGVRDVG